MSWKEPQHFAADVFMNDNVLYFRGISDFII